MPTNRPACESHARWYCVKVQPKQETSAAETLRRLLGLECHSPRIRYRKQTARGPVWFTEAMFPGYIFVRFIYEEQHRNVQFAPRVSTIVRFGTQVVPVPDNAVEALRQVSGDAETVVFAPELTVGEQVRIAEGALQGMEAVITEVLPGKKRVRLLLDFLGRAMTTEVEDKAVLPSMKPPHQRGME